MYCITGEMLEFFCSQTQAKDKAGSKVEEVGKQQNNLKDLNWEQRCEPVKQKTSCIRFLNWGKNKADEGWARRWKFPLVQPKSNKAKLISLFEKRELKAMAAELNMYHAQLNDYKAVGKVKKKGTPKTRLLRPYEDFQRCFPLSKWSGRDWAGDQRVARYQAEALHAQTLSSSGWI